MTTQDSQNLTSPAVAASQSTQPADFKVTRERQLDFRDHLETTEGEPQARKVLQQYLNRIPLRQEQRSNADIYDEVQEALCGDDPLRHDPLLRFLRLWVEEFQNRLQICALASSQERRSGTGEASELRRTDAGSGPDTDTVSDHAAISFRFAEEFPDQTLFFLKKLEDLRVGHADAVFVYELSEFVGCQVAQISRLLGCQEDEAESTHREITIRVHSRGAVPAISKSVDLETLIAQVAAGRRELRLPLFRQLCKWVQSRLALQVQPELGFISTVWPAVQDFMSSQHLVESSDKRTVNLAGAYLMRLLLADAATRAHAEPVEAQTMDAPSTDARLGLDYRLIHLSLQKLESEHPVPVRLLELCYIAGLNHREAAELLEISEPQVDQRWVFAKVKLAQQLRRQGESQS